MVRTKFFKKISAGSEGQHSYHQGRGATLWTNEKLLDVVTNSSHYIYFLAFGRIELTRLLFHLCPSTITRVGVPFATSGICSKPGQNVCKFSFFCNELRVQCPLVADLSHCKENANFLWKDSKVRISEEFEFCQMAWWAFEDLHKNLNATLIEFHIFYYCYARRTKDLS